MSYFDLADWMDRLTEDDTSEPLPTVQCLVCGKQHAAPDCKWNDSEEDEDVPF